MKFKDSPKFLIFTSPPKKLDDFMALKKYYLQRKY